MSATRFNRHIGNKKWQAFRWRAKLDPGVKLPDIPTRQRKRAARRKAALAYMLENWGGESRRTRRSMAFTLAKRDKT